MRLIRQSFLWFKEGNSDKVYEIDLCEVGSGRFVVNFRYGRRGAVLKEATKTPVPVSQAEAEKIFSAVEAEKLDKGYTSTESSSGNSATSAAFSLAATAVTIDNSWMNLPANRNKAILQRLYNAVTGTGTPRHPWKLSRVIWKAGEYKIQEAVPYIIQLFNNADSLQQYSCVWALARCGGPVALSALQEIQAAHPSPSIKKIAGAGLVKQPDTSEAEKHSAQYLDNLGEELKNAVQKKNTIVLSNLLNENVNQLEYLYLLSHTVKWLRPLVKNSLQELPLKPGAFKQIRSVFKLSELLDDFEMNALLASRFERDPEFFTHFLSEKAKSAAAEVFISTLDEYLSPGRELKKANSRLAFSQKTKWYLARRTRRKLRLLGITGNTDYVKFATGLLLQYDNLKDTRQPFSLYKYEYVNGRYQQKEIRHPESAQAVFLHYILQGQNPELELAAHGKNWRYRDPENRQSAQQAGTKGTGGFLQKLAGLFTKKKTEASLPQQVTRQEPEGLLAFVPYIQLWNQVPQAYVQLLMEAKLEDIHLFAHLGITTHPQYSEIKSKLDKEACKKLLLSAFSLPAEWGYTITREKFENSLAEDDLVNALLDSIHLPARDTGRRWTENFSSTLFGESRFVAGLLLARYPEIRAWGRELITRQSFTSDLRMSISGKVIAGLMAINTRTEEQDALIREATDNLLDLFGREITNTGLPVIADLLQHENPAVLLAGLKLLKAKADKLNPAELSDEFIFSLLHHAYAPVREEGIALLKLQPASVLLQRQEGILQACLSSFENVRNQLPPLIQKMADADHDFGIRAAEYLMPWLQRKETVEGLHASTSRLLCNELSNYLQQANKDQALHLLYSHYPAAQNVGVIILEKYTERSQLTLPQVIALGSHENLNVREWCYKFYREETARIRYEKETAVKLLESKWEDTRAFSMTYFREQFREEDWDSSTLISLADSVKPDIEALGRELITKFFHSDKGEEYLLKLSQHPSGKMQLFATNYLERYAAGDSSKLAGLEFYFRSVLTSVNKSRVAKDRIYRFLLDEGRKSAASASVAGRILSDVSATAVAMDKSRCIEILLQLNALFEMETPLTIKETEMRGA